MGLVEAALCCSRYSPCSAIGNVVGNCTLPQQPSCASRRRTIPAQLGPDSRSTRAPTRKQVRQEALFLVGVGVARGLHLDAQRRAHQLEFLAEPPFEETLIGLGHVFE